MAIKPDQLSLLKQHLSTSYIAHVPALLKPKTPEDDNSKNIDRAFSAFALVHLCDATIAQACAAIVDDYDDFGIDAVFYKADEETLYLVQAKLKAGAMFNQAEGNGFCQGIRKIIKQDYTDFNQHIVARQTDIDGALEQCSAIRLVVAHTGDGISVHAQKALDDLVAEECQVEERLKGPIIDFDASRVAGALEGAKAYPRIDTKLTLNNYGFAANPRIAYYGTVSLSQLAALHKVHDKALYERNIRNFLGKTTDVNRAIRETLTAKLELFQYLNNGVTALCERIEPKNGTAKEKVFSIRGFSIVNGAQTVASTARFVEDFPAKDISAARVMITLIKADADGTFGKAVTRARNHQNPVHLANFAALDDDQQRLRRQLALLGITYVYKAEALAGAADPQRVFIAEAVQALAVCEPDPRFPVWLKKEPGQFLDTDGEAYKKVFNPALTAYRLANAVRVFRYVRSRVQTEILGSAGQERLTYKHGEFALAYLIAKQLRSAVNAPTLIDPTKLATEASAPFDVSRQMLWDAMRPRVHYKGPLASFRNQTEAIPIIRDAMIANFGLAADPAIPPLQAKFVIGQNYQVDLYKYLSDNAPQIGSVA